MLSFRSPYNAPGVSVIHCVQYCLHESPTEWPTADKGRLQPFAGAAHSLGQGFETPVPALQSRGDVLGRARALSEPPARLPWTSGVAPRAEFKLQQQAFEYLHQQGEPWIRYLR